MPRPRRRPVGTVRISGRTTRVTSGSAAHDPHPPRRRCPLVVLFLVVVIDLIGFGIVLPLLPRYAEKYDASPLQLGILMASFSAMQFLFAPFWGRLSDRRGRRPILMVGLFGSVVAYAVSASADADAVPSGCRRAPGVF